MTTLEIIMEHKALLAIFAIFCLTALAVATQSDRLSDDWFPDGFEFRVSPLTALVGCLVIFLLSTFFGSGATYGGSGN
jgi:hypothetical protein